MINPFVGAKALIKIVGKDESQAPVIVAHPAIQTTEAVDTTVQTRNGNIRTQFAWFLSLREPNPNGAFAGQPAILVSSYENIRFLSPRQSAVEGLDIEDGAMLDLAVVEARYEEQQDARLLARAVGAAPATVSLADLVNAE